MEKRKPTKLEKSTAIKLNAKCSQWCYVDTNNEFKFMNKTFQIDEKVKEYKVHNKAQYIDGKLNDFTNEAYMDEILVVIDKQDRLRFYNQNYDPIDGKLIKLKE